MTPFLLSTVLAAAAAGPSMALSVSPQHAGTPARAPDGDKTGAVRQRSGIPRVQPPRGGVVQVNAVDDAPEPSPRLSVQEPSSADSGAPGKKRARTERTEDQTDPYMEALLEQSRAQTEALPEQSRDQTETLQQIAAQQRASERARIAEQQARIQRAAQLNRARMGIRGSLQSLQTMGDWNADALNFTGASLGQTAAAASEAGSFAEASRATEAARFVEAAHAALAQRNAQLAEYYLLEANRVLLGAPNVR